MTTQKLTPIISSCLAFVCAAAILFSLCPSYANAAEFRLMQNNAEPGVPILYFSGEIQPGDTQRLIKFLRSNLDIAPLINDVWLNSPGGNLSEAMKLGVLMETLGYTAVVPAGAKCASACFFVWIGASARLAQGEVVVHRPYFEMHESPASAFEYEQAYRESHEAAYNYLRQRGVPTQLIELMMRVSSVEGYTLSNRDIASMGMMSQARMEYMIQSCGLPTSEQAAQIQAQGGLSQAELKSLRECGLKFYQKQKSDFFFGG